jgi:uncharacterized protein (DUF1499 family)
MWPPINDITTELEQASDAQKRAYPYVQPLLLGLPPAQAFDAALAAARDMGLAIASADAATGVVTAVATTRLLRFKDDVTVRVREVSDVASGSRKSRIDVRSKSRVGRGDLGTNARRIRRYLEMVRARLPSG